MTVTTCHRPSNRECLGVLDAAFADHELVTLLGRCTVAYEGRAESRLGPGDRLVVLKPDGTALVHTTEGRTPVNWQPPGCEHRASVRDGRLVVTSVRDTPEERITVRFERVYQCTTLDATDEADLDLYGSEADLKERVLAEPSLVAPGFDPVATERETAAGPVDVFGHDGAGRPVVVELKRRRVGPDAVGQLRRYVEAVRDEIGDDAAVRGVLVAPSVTDRAASLLDDAGFEHAAVAPPTEAADADGVEEASAGDGPGDGEPVDDQPTDEA